MARGGDIIYLAPNNVPARKSLFLEKDEIGNMMLDNVLAIIADRPL